MSKNPKEQTKNKEKQSQIILKEPSDDELFYNSNTCPVCGSDELIVEGRCTTCLNCGWSKCSI